MSSTIINSVDFGPLAGLVGLWKGDKGMDIAPESDGSKEANPYYEELLIEVAGGATNAEKQRLAVLRYHQKVFRVSDGQQFHDQIGYWIWDADDQRVMFTLSIPRGVSLVAGGIADVDGETATLTVESAEGSDWGVAQSPFMRDNAKTKGFKMQLSVNGDAMEYSQTTFLDIYGREFDHTDNSTLRRV
ncbi:heme-binding beta-barrel domain-containing protein [Oceanicoccus sp. KOV_DT_Chl]|uniref:heme-binding beta-barrel domain-containing protein n=1 Tax=Oceanicoccus sp. KOV_DT_Chl TaxID=1904639 RepID=UPI00190E7031|nr:heme-binding beta-barrel domain-containing protein [Oceanicoccus sp. KOV_DT_Chl]